MKIRTFKNFSDFRLYVEESHSIRSEVDENIDESEGSCNGSNDDPDFISKVQQQENKKTKMGFYRVTQIRNAKCK